MPNTFITGISSNEPPAARTSSVVVGGAERLHIAPGIATVTGEVRIVSGGTLNTHLNYQNGGSNFISQANNGATYIRNASNANKLVIGDTSANFGVPIQISGTTVIDASRNITGVNIDATGTIRQTQSGGNYIEVKASSAANAGYYMQNSSRVWYMINDAAGNLQFYNGTSNTVPLKILGSNGDIQVNNTTVIDASRNLTNIGSIASSGNIVNDIGASGADSFIEFKNTGYTGNVTSIRQNADSTRAEFNSTERSIHISAGSEGSASAATVKIFANQQLGLTIDANGNGTSGDVQPTQTKD